MKTQKILTKTLALLMTVAMLLALVPAAFAADGDPAVDLHNIDLGKTGHIYVTKYQTTGLASGANGTTDDKPLTSSTEANGTDNFVPGDAYSTLDKAEFKLYQIADSDQLKAYYDGMQDKAFEYSDFFYSGSNYPATPGENAVYKVRDFTNINSDTVSLSPYATEETKDGGQITFEVPVGIYLLVETSAPETISAPLSVPCLISVPMVNSSVSNNLFNNDNDSYWNYEVYVFPKNHEAEGKATVKKYGKNGVDTASLLENTKFVIMKNALNQEGDLTKWEKVDEATTAVDAVNAENSCVVTFDHLEANLYGTKYMIYEDTTQAGYIADRRPIVFTVKPNNTIEYDKTANARTGLNDVVPTVGPVPELNLTVTNYEPTIEKLVSREDGTPAEGVQGNIGETFIFQLEIAVPENLKDLSTFKITEAFEETQFALGKATIKVDETVIASNIEWKNNAIELAGENKTITSGQQGDLVDAAKAGKTIKVTYDAQLLKDAVIGGTGNLNTATLTYPEFITSGDPTNIPDPTGTNTQKIIDRAAVYTYQLKLTKYMDVLSEGNEGAGVEFMLLKGTDKTPVELIETSTGSGVYRLPYGQEEGKTTLITNNKGIIKIIGLENDTYYLRETKTKKDYNMLASDLEYKIDYTFEGAKDIDGAEFSNGEKKQEEDAAVASDWTEQATSKNAVNKKGFVLPQTGSMGYLLFCAAGLLLIGGGAALIFSDRKKVIR